MDPINSHIGSSFDDFLEEEGIKEEAETIAKHRLLSPQDFKDPQPLKCPPIDGSQTCPYLHCLACKAKLFESTGSYLCFVCDAVYLLKDRDDTQNS